MSNTDGFIEEVTEEVRQDKLFAAFRKYGWIAGVLVLGIVGGTAWSEWSKSNQRALAQAQGDAILTAAETSDESQRAALLSDIAATYPNSAIAQLAAAEGSNTVDILQAVANNTDFPSYQRDLARLKLAIIPDVLSAADQTAVLQELSQAGGAYAGPATEFLASHLLNQGDRDGALVVLQARISDAAASPTQVRRLVELIVALGETPQLAAGLSPDTQN